MSGTRSSDHDAKNEDHSLGGRGDASLVGGRCYMARRMGSQQLDTTQRVPARQFCGQFDDIIRRELVRAMTRPRFIASLCFVALLAIAPSALAQALTGAGMFKPFAGAVPFAGSGDTVSGAFAYWSCARAYTSAYAAGGGNACDIIRASDSATCTTKFNSTGFLDVSTAYCNGSTQSVTAFCNATTCKITKAYDQSGASSCTTACDASQSTDANRPVLTLASGPNSNKVCMTFAGGQSLETPAITIAQPISGSFVSNRTGTTTSYSDILGSNAATGTVQFLYNAATDQGGIFAGSINSSQTVAMTDNAFHALNMVLNGASSIVDVDGSATTGLNPGPGAMNSPDTVALGNFNHALTGVICEARLDSIAYNATQYGNLNTNQHSTSGYNF